MIETPWGILPAIPIYILTAILGASFGSFANVLIYRLPAELSLVTPPSRCPSCESRIAWYDNVPILSWLFLGGKCRSCKAPVSIQYVLIEAASTLISVFAVWRFGFNYSGLAYGLLFIGLLALVIIDLRHWLLPFAITIPLFFVGLAGSVFFDLLPWQAALIGAGVGFGVFLVMMFGGKLIFGREAMGGGDVVFGAMAGVFLGWQLTLLMIFIASLLGTFMALIMLILRKGVNGRSVPFGPFLAVALVVCIFAGQALVDWYIGVLRP
ncbi:prepilin peptidase [bacterium]|nr:prepilin peptidase [bacterium]